ncbi:MAG: hypothetical protein ACK55O_06950, partial [Phycisphaerales bacterium]
MFQALKAWRHGADRLPKSEPLLRLGPGGDFQRDLIGEVGGEICDSGEGLDIEQDGVGGAGGT